LYLEETYLLYYSKDADRKVFPAFFKIMKEFEGASVNLISEGIIKESQRKRGLYYGYETRMGRI